MIYFYNDLKYVYQYFFEGWQKMSRNKGQGEEIQQFIIWNIRAHPLDIVQVAQERFSLSRTAVLRHIHLLEQQERIQVEGPAQNRRYFFKATQPFDRSYPLQHTLAGDRVWREDLHPLFGGIKENVLGICNYGFTEIFNNAVAHSEGTTITVVVEFCADLISMTVSDDGMGIFNKVRKKYTLEDPMHAVLELSKGKLTTDPKNRKGEGIFFTSRMFDTFILASGNLTFGHRSADLFFEDDTPVQGTAVVMKLSPLSDRTKEGVFSQFVSGFGFDKTIVPVQLVQSGNENLITRSQAKKLLARLDRFRSVVLDFANVESIGRAFADEVFRVFARSRPGITLIPINENAAIKALIAEMTGGK
jgi:hypothetical protein